MKSKTQVWFIHYLRVLAAFAVILIHAAARSSFSYGRISLSSWWGSNLISSATHWSVPVFVMMSGYLLLEPSKSKQITTFYLSRLKKLLLPLCSAVIFYAFYYHWTRHDPLKISFVITRLIFDQPYEHLFFLIVLLELTVITPFLSTLINSYPKRKFFYVMMGLILMSIFWQPVRFVGLLFIPYLSYYLGGYWLKKYPLKINRPTFILLSMGLIFLISLGTYLLVSHSSPNRNGLYFYTYFNPLGIILSTLIFIFFQQQETQLPRLNFVSRLSAVTLGIYLIHPVILDLFSFTRLPASFSGTLISLVSIALIVFTSSASIVAIYQQLKLAILRMCSSQLIKNKH